MGNKQQAKHGRKTPASSDDTSSQPLERRFEPAAARLRPCVAAALIVAAGLAAYSNCYKGQFVYDGVDAVEKNICIRKLWPLSEAMSLPLTKTGTTVDGRPVLSLSFALNYALFGPSLTAYHAGNLAIHIAAALVLFGLVRRVARGAGRGAGDGLAAAVALLWVVHPIQTESVTYVAQRAESLMGLFYLLTLYAAVRGFECDARSGTSDSRPATSDRRRARRLWYAASIVACGLGMATKEVMISAPLVVLACDYIFVRGSLKEIFRRRWGFCAGLAATWGVTLWLLTRGGFHNIGEDYASRSALWYALTQPRIVLHYLRLSVWPHPLVMDYNWAPVSSITEMLPEGFLLATLLALTGWGVWRRKAYGFLGLCFFFVLAPTSSFFPTSQTCHEHRMYLPLAVVILLAVTGIARILRETMADPRKRTATGAVAVLCVTVAFVAVSLDRNRDYHSVSGFWAQNARERPQSAVAQTNVGVALYRKGRRNRDEAYYQQAIKRFRIALKHNPRHYSAYNHWGVMLFELGYTAEAMEMYRRALKIMPTFASALDNLGNAHSRLGQFGKAITCYREALESSPRSAAVRSNLGAAYLREGRPDEAIPHFRRALDLDPDNVEALNNLGTAYHRQGRSQEAIECYYRSIKLKPNRAKTHRNLALILGEANQIEPAIQHALRADTLHPDNPATLLLLAKLLALKGDIPRAVQAGRRALALAEAAQNTALAGEIQAALKQIQAH